ncbi:hypothetical protein RF55_20429 [Lasius niger]|uniref:Uncharacterized protein n=1 Tax=Lasius niger TaxID=67767 RepID=A0A0J7JYY1_LASNI|nr:hypothetical protein RF55_20429 [Lasius niger]
MEGRSNDLKRLNEMEDIKNLLEDGCDEILLNAALQFERMQEDNKGQNCDVVEVNKNSKEDDEEVQEDNKGQNCDVVEVNKNSKEDDEEDDCNVVENKKLKRREEEDDEDDK